MKHRFMKNLKMTNLDDVPANLRCLYVKTSAEGEEDVFEIPAELHDIAKSLDGFNTSNQKLRTENDSFKATIKGHADWSVLGENPEAVQASITDLQDQVAKGSEGEVNWEKMKGDLQGIQTKELEKRDAAVEKMRGTLHVHLVDSVATKALSDEKGAVGLLLPHVRKQTKVIEGEDGIFRARVVDDAGDFRVGGEGDFMSIAELVTEMKSDPEFGRAFEAEKKGGSGATPSPSVNRQMKPADMSPLQKLKVGMQQGGK